MRPELPAVESAEQMGDIDAVFAERKHHRFYLEKFFSGIRRLANAAADRCFRCDATGIHGAHAVKKRRPGQLGEQHSRKAPSHELNDAVAGKTKTKIPAAVDNIDDESG